MTGTHQVREGDVLYAPTRDEIEASNIFRYMEWLRTEHALTFDSYDALWRWSIHDVGAFWESLWEYFRLPRTPDAPRRPDVPDTSNHPDTANHPDPSNASSSRVPKAGLEASQQATPGVRWFEGTRLNFTAQVFVRRDDHLAIVYECEDGRERTMTYAELHREVARLRHGLLQLGVQANDRVVSLLPNCPEAVAAFLATASLGAIWSSCSPEFGVGAVLDRFQQIAPKVLFAVDAYPYAGKTIDRHEALDEIRAKLPTLEATVMLRRAKKRSAARLEFDREIGREMEREVEREIDPHESADLDFESFGRPLPNNADTSFECKLVPFDHPLWVLYSSGTTGLPKAIVHGHGGIILELYKTLTFHCDIKPEDRFFWFTTTGWMMWNFLVGGLLVGATIVLYEGSPGHPSLERLWDLAAKRGVTYFGTSAPFLLACAKQGIEPSKGRDLSRIRAVGSTGAPLPAEGFGWVYQKLHDRVLLGSVSGGTDVCTAFVGSCPLLPVHAGEIQCRALGVDVRAFAPDGTSLENEVGELVITKPLPSMPVAFWNDPEGTRFRESYFDRFPGAWSHGDWIKFTPRGSCIIYGRSDATLNRDGVRMGTSEFYRVVESMSEVEDSLVVDTSGLGRSGKLWLFVVLRPGSQLNAGLREKIVVSLRTTLSPRYAPDEIRAVPKIPRTLSGKKVEIPVRKILLGTPKESALSQDTLADPAALDILIRIAADADAGATQFARH